MASSGSVDFGLTRDNVIQDVLEQLQVMQAGDTTSSASFTDHSATIARSMNMLCKQWMGVADFAPGLKMWLNKRAYLFLQKGEGVYTLGPTVAATAGTDKWTSAYGRTTISATEAAGQTVITVVDNGITIANTNRIGIMLDTGYLQWTTVSGTPTDNGTTLDVTIAVALTSAAAAGNSVFVYATTTQGRRPLHIIHAALRDTDGNDTPITPMLLDSYEGIATKMTESTPLRYYYEDQLTNGVLYFDCEASDATDVLRVVYAGAVEDFDSAGDDADYPQVWLRPLAWGAALDSLGKFGQESRAPYFKGIRDEALAIARNTNAETSESYFCPGDSA